MCAPGSGLFLNPARGPARKRRRSEPGRKKFAPQDGVIRAREERGANSVPFRRPGLKFRKGGPVAGLQQKKPRRRSQCEQRRGFPILPLTPEMWQ